MSSLVVQADGKILVGGGFTMLGMQPRSYIARLHAGGSLDRDFNPMANGWVSALAVQADGKILVGGSFTTLDGQPRSCIARLNADGTLDPDFDPVASDSIDAGTSASVSSLAVQTDGKILVGGNFSTLDGQPRSCIARLNADGTLDPDFDAEADEVVSSLVVQSDGKILVSGDFGWLGGEPRLGIGRLNADGTLDKDFNPGTDHVGYSLAVQPDGRILVGGLFTTLGGQGIRRLNADGTLDRDLNSVANGWVSALTVQSDGKILVGGRFTTLDGQPRSCIARLNADGTLDFRFDPEANDEVSVLVVQSDGKILVGGEFTTLGGEPRGGIARLNAAGTLDTMFNPEGSDQVSSLAVQPDGKIVVGGGFTTLGGEERSGIARLNADGALDRDFDPRANGRVDSLVVQADGKILVGGWFDTLSGQPRNHIARLNADGTLDGEFDPGGDDDVFSLASQADGKILVGGRFRRLGGQPRNFIGRLNADGTLDRNFDPRANRWVESLVVQADGKILVGGGFDTLDGQTRDHIARLNADGTLDSNFDPGANNSVHSLTLQADGKILVGGLFTSLGGEPRNRIARLNADGTLDRDFNPDLNPGVVAWVDSLAVQTDGRILVGGPFTMLGGQPRDCIARLNADGTLDSDFDLGANFAVHSLALQADGKILVGGWFTTLGGQPRHRIGRLNNTKPATQSLAYDGSTITWLRGGASPEVAWTTFESSIDGVTWIDLGVGTRTLDGWQLAGVSLPSEGTVRARGYVGDGVGSWFVESYLGTPNGLTINGELDLGNLNGGSQLTVLNGLTLNGTILLGNRTNDAYGGIHFIGTQTLGGTGTVLLGNSACNSLRLTEAGTTLTLGPGITVRGHSGYIGYSECWGGSADVTVVNQGTILADVAGGTIQIRSPLASVGRLHVVNGAVLDLDSTLTLTSSDELIVQHGGTLRLAGDLVGSVSSPHSVRLAGILELDGDGTVLAPQLLEVMSADLGPDSMALSGPFAYGTLALGNDTYVRLVDQSDNSPGTNSEVLYVESLVIPAGCTLDLNGLKLYARAVHVGGTIIAGEVRQVPGGGPLRLGITTRAAIASASDLDEWTFFGRAGRTYTLAVDPGGGNVFDPKLRYADVHLLDPSGGLVARGSNAVAEQAVMLTEIVLPMDGTYRTHVRTPTHQPSATGNYQITFWEITSDTMPLVLSQTVSGRIETPYSIDHWTFSAVANQQVQFDLINTSMPGVVFTLHGPDGWIGFSDLVNDSGLVNLPADGRYTLTAQGIASAHDVTYAFKLVETTQTSLTTGDAFTGQFIGSGQAQLFLVTVTNSGPLRIKLTGGATDNRTALYAARAGPPTRGSFDLGFAFGSGANHDLLIPNAPVGTFYLLVYGDHIPSPGPFTIEVAAGMYVTNIAPTRHANNVDFAMTLTGMGFETGTTVELLTEGGILAGMATNVSVDSFTQLTANFPPNLAPPGLYSVRLRQPDGDSAILTNTFEVLATGAPKLVTHLVMPDSLGRHAVATIYVEYANEGTASMPAPLLVLKSSDPDGSDRPILTLDTSRIIQNFWSAKLPPGTGNEVFILASGTQPGVLGAGERRLVPVYYLGLQQPWDFSDNNVEMEIRYWTADSPSPIDWSERKESLRPPTLDLNTWDVVYANLTAELATTGDYVRMLGDNAQFLGRLGQVVTDVGDLWNFEVQQAYGFSTIPVLDSTVDSTVTAPGVALDLARHFGPNVRARNSTGWFGRGWYTPWEARLVAENSGDLVKLVGEAGSAHIFTRDIRNNRYFSGAGDTSTLAVIDGGLYELRDSNGIVTRFRPDGRMAYVEDPNGNRVTATWDSADRLTTLSHTSGAFISMAYNGAGFIQSVTNSAGRSTTYSYAGSYLQTVTTDDGKVTTHTYETAGTPAQRHALQTVTRGGATRTFTFDTQGRVTSTFLATGEQSVQFGYDSAGGVSITDAHGTTHLLFDHRGLLAKVMDPLGNVTTAEFDEELRLSRLVAPTGESQSFDWCGCGSPTRITDESGHTTTFRYDNPFKRLTSFTDARGNTTAYTYDPRGNLLSTIYPNNSIEQFGGHTAFGLPQKHINRRGQALSYTYTASGQVDRQIFMDGSYNKFDYDYRGNLTNVLEHPASGPNKVTSYTYDYVGSGDRLRKVTYPNDRWVEFFYDAFGRRERMTDGTGQDLRYDYDSAGRLWRLRDVTDAVLVEYRYNAAGGLQRVNKGNATYTTYEYDAAGQLLHLINHAPNGSVNSRFDYTYDQRGRRTSMETVGGKWTYDYDATGQLVRAQLASTNSQIFDQDLQYSYDALGNRTHIITNGLLVNYIANNLNQYTSVGGIVYQYDADGNLTFDGVRNYEYTSGSRLERVTGPEGVTEYEYDALGSRTAKVFNGQREEYLIDPLGTMDVVAEHDAIGTLLCRNIYALGLLSRETRSFSFYDYDGLGATAGLSDFRGLYSDSYSYLPFGSVLNATVVTNNPFQFVGQFGVQMEESGLLFMRARFQSPATGRFLSPDPMRIASGFNFYAYTGNQPTGRIDPIGLDWSTDGAGGGCRLIFQVLGGVAGTIAGSALPMPNVSGPLIGGAGALVGDYIGYYVCRPSTPWIPSEVPPWPLPPPPFPPDPLPPGAPVPAPPPTPPPVGPPDGGGPDENGESGDTGIANSEDPNEKFGAKGVGVKNWVKGNALIPYRINFENLGPGSVDGSGNPYSAFATAPAQRVTISDLLDPNLDWSTFQLIELGFGDTIVPISAGRTHYIGSVPMTYNHRTFSVELEAGIDLVSGRVFAVFQSIDPQTSLPPEVLTGFLPPEDGTGRGMGHFSFLIRARTNLVTGTEIRNVALIEFDHQMTIATDQVDPQDPSQGVDSRKQALVTLDDSPPNSTVLPLPPSTPTTTFTVSWSGHDTGAGIANFDVFVSDNGGEWARWQSGTTNTSASFSGQVGHLYHFYSTARDLLGHVEHPPSTADAITQIAIPPSPALSIELLDGGTSEEDQVRLTYPVESGFDYRVEFREALDSETVWQSLASPPHNSGSVIVPIVERSRFFRLHRINRE